MEKIRFYTREHMWVELDNCKHWLFGISQYGSDRMQGVVNIDVKPGPEYVGQGEDFMWVESRKAVEILHMPFERGILLASNKEVEFNPSILDDRAEETDIGVINAPEFKIEDAGRCGLMLPVEYRKYIESLEEA